MVRVIPSKRMMAWLAIAVFCALIVWFESHHTIAAFRAWTFGMAFLIAATATALARGRVRDGLLVLSTLVFGLCAAEVAAGVLEPKGESSITPFWVTPIPVIGYGFNRSGVIHARKSDAAHNLIYDVHYTVDAHFDRLVTSSETGPTVVFFGDSFTFGEGVNDADTLPQRYADLGGRQQRVLNLGVSGYSPQEFLRLVETGLRDDLIGPKPQAVVFLTSPFHAMRTACKESWTDVAPRYALVNGTVTYQGPCYAGRALWLHEFLRNTALYRATLQPLLVRLTRADVDLYVQILARAVRLAAQRYGVEPLVPFVGVGEAYLAGTGYTNATILGALKGEGVHVVDMTLASDPAKGLVYEFAGDGHPTPAANTIRARMIAAALKEPTGAGQAASSR